MSLSTRDMSLLNDPDYEDVRIATETITEDLNGTDPNTWGIAHQLFALVDPYVKLQRIGSSLYGLAAEMPFNGVMAVHALQMGFECEHVSDMVKQCALQWVIAAPLEILSLYLGVQCISFEETTLRRGGPVTKKGRLEEEVVLDWSEQEFFDTYEESPKFAEERYTIWGMFILTDEGLLDDRATAASKLRIANESWTKIEDVLENVPIQDQSEIPGLFNYVFWEQVNHFELSFNTEEEEKETIHRSAQQKSKIKSFNKERRKFFARLSVFLGQGCSMEGIIGEYGISKEDLREHFIDETAHLRKLIAPKHPAQRGLKSLIKNL
ncbi:hypothetical protein UCREL1_8887 [Eutypa lata UCREL1]|uniref:Uncharacterized protein n=1 Tax=Eutypa lata (strain UCR-EL1) TaxID=1287681 RepID=M7T2X5_EUTLA|nr:hypothetical protein UCREL1_8887 [Eutypa lata UCREL1]